MEKLSMDFFKEVQEIKMLKEIDDLTGLFQILVFLQRFGRGNVSNFVKDLRLNQQPVYRTLAKLMELGFIEMDTKSAGKRGNFPSKYYSLTPKGAKLAKHIDNAFDVYKKL